MESFDSSLLPTKTGIPLQTERTASDFNFVLRKSDLLSNNQELDKWGDVDEGDREDAVLEIAPYKNFTQVNCSYRIHLLM